MARKSKGGESKAISMRQNTRRGDIYSAAKSTMEPADYSRGYPANEGELLNMNFSGRIPNKGKG